MTLIDLEIDYRKDGRCVYKIVVGLMSIGTIFSPQKGVRDRFICRLNFNQEIGKIDFSKDRQFDTLDECKEYIHEEFKKLVKRLNTYYVLNKHKSTTK